MKIENRGHHLEQMIQQTRAHHVQLSAMADSKAQMLIVVSAIVIPLTMQYLDDKVLRGPAALLIMFMIITICQASVAVMPGKSKPKDATPTNPLFNPLFFGFFTSMSREEYLKHMEGIMLDENQSYEVMLTEIYGLGQYLENHKYKHVRRGYFTFIAGLVFSFALGGFVWFLQSSLYQEWVNI